MHILRLGFVAFVLASIAGFGVSRAQAATSPQFSPAIQAKIAAAVERERSVYGGRTPVPGWLVGVFDDQGRSFVRGFGYADLATHRKMGRDDAFRIGSNTKTFVVTVLLQLVDEKKLGLDDPLSRFALGVTVPNAKHITVRQLAEMRSGLFEAYNTPQLNKMNITGATVFDPRTLVRWAVAQKPYFAPGARYNYSNTNYLILGLLIEALTKDTYGHQIQTRLLDRYGLHHTIVPSTQAMPDPWAHGYGLTKNNGWEDLSGTIPVSLMWSAGEMISTLDDMKRWVKLYVTGATNSAATQRARLRCLYIGKDNGWFGLGIGCSNGWYGYTGGLPGYNTATYYMPTKGITVVSWAPLQRDKPIPGAATSVIVDVARILTPDSVPVVGPKRGPGPPGQ